MRRSVCSTLLAATAALSGTAAWPCGDKLLVIGRGVRFQHAYAAREANLVIYSAAGRNAAALSSNKLQTALKRAVHKMQLVRGSSELDSALKSGQVDVVLVDFADLAGITQQLRAAPSKPVILPIVDKPSKAELAAVQKQYKFALSAAADNVAYLAAVDEAMKLRLKAGARS